MKKLKRILLKLSGESLMGKGQYGICPDMARRVACEVQNAQNLGIQICIVVGGGNIYRGVSGAAQGMDRTSADNMGMLATVINAIALQNAMEQIGLETRVLSAIAMDTVCEPFIRRRAIRHMEKGRIVICAGGVGNPYFTTDTASALRASELQCDAVLKATKVDGVYTADPVKDPSAKRYARINFMDVIKNDLGVMDASAISLCRDNDIGIYVFSILEEGGLHDVLTGKGHYSYVHGGETLLS